MARNAAVRNDPVPTIGDQIDRLYELREEIRALTKKADELKAEKAKLEASLIEQMEDQGVDRISGTLATVSIGESDVPQVEDWDKFHKFIRRNNAFYLLESRAAAAPYRELIASRGKRPVPGVVTFTKCTLGLRKR